MKREALYPILASMIILLILTIPQVSTVEANFLSFKPDTPGLYVYHPDSNHVYVIDPILNILFYYAMEDNSSQISFSYSLDNRVNFPLSATLKQSDYVYYYTVSSTLNNLTDGDHTLTVYADCSNGTINAIINTEITVDAAANTPIVVSPLNQTTYNTKQVPLTYTINKEILWSYYSIDSTDNSDLKSFNGNISLPTLSEGQHKLTLAVTTNNSDVTTNNPTPHQTIQTIIFSINTTTPSPTVPEFPITTSLVTVLSAVSLLLIIGKRKLIIINH